MSLAIDGDAGLHGDDRRRLGALARRFEHLEAEGDAVADRLSEALSRVAVALLIAREVFARQQPAVEVGR